MLKKSLKPETGKQNYGNEKSTISKAAISLHCSIKKCSICEKSYEDENKVWVDCAPRKHKRSKTFTKLKL